MTVDELRELCNKPSMLESASERTIVIKMDGKWGRSQTKLLAGRGSPVGQITGEHRGKLTVQFKAKEVLAWLDKMTAQL